MKDISREVSDISREVLECYQVRKTGKQKAAFRARITEWAAQNGYSAAVEKGRGGSKNIVFGNPETAKVVFTAHYDTCAVLPLPNFITPKNIPVIILSQILLACLLMAPCVLIYIVAGLLLDGFVAYLIFLASLLGLIALMLAGPANRHTANDNTSGVAAVLETMIKLDNASRGTTAFVLFDLEEAGLIGSSSYYSAHKAAFADRLVVNLDCVSDGDNFMFAFRKGARASVELFKRCYFAPEKSFSFCTGGVFYPSDQMNFPAGVGVAALKKSRIVGLYMDRIHTPRDTVFDQNNIEILSAGNCRLAEALCKQNIG